MTQPTLRPLPTVDKPLEQSNKEWLALINGMPFERSYREMLRDKATPPSAERIQEIKSAFAEAEQIIDSLSDASRAAVL